MPVMDRGAYRAEDEHLVLLCPHSTTPHCAAVSRAERTAAQLELSSFTWLKMSTLCPSARSLGSSLCSSSILPEACGEAQQQQTPT